MQQIAPISFPNDDTSYICPSWDQMNMLTFSVSQKIKQDGIKFDRIVTLAKGGWPMTRSLVDFLHIPTVASIGIKFYFGINQRLDKPKIYQDIPVSIKDEKILLFDDVADSGESLIFTKEHLLQRGAKIVKTATIYTKFHSKITPDYYGGQTKAWIIFPFEPFEMTELLSKKWKDQGIEQKEILQRLNKLNFVPKFMQPIRVNGNKDA